MEGQFPQTAVDPARAIDRVSQAWQAHLGRKSERDLWFFDVSGNKISSATDEVWAIKLTVPLRSGALPESGMLPAS